MARSNGPVISKQQKEGSLGGFYGRKMFFSNSSVQLTSVATQEDMKKKQPN